MADLILPVLAAILAALQPLYLWRLWVIRSVLAIPAPPPAPEPEALQPAQLTLRLRRADRDAVIREW